MIWNWTWSTDFSIIAIVGWIIPLVMLFIVPVNRKPSSATAWLMLIFLLPFSDSRGILNLTWFAREPSPSTDKTVTQRLASSQVEM